MWPAYDHVRASCARDHLLVYFVALLRRQFACMKRLLFLLLAAIYTLSASALDVAAGTYYFDNSRTRYASVRFVCGTNLPSSNVTYVISLTNVGNNRWQLIVPSDLRNMYRYTFAATCIPDGTLSSNFATVKDSISNQLHENRTATTDMPMMPGWVFTPSSGDNWAQGEWVDPSSSQGAVSATPSGTLPVLYINTNDGRDITSTEEYVAGTYWLDNMGDAAYASIGSATAPLPLEVRGRGNWTWRGFDKKPYKIKLTAGQKLMGMHKSKHFALLAEADDPYAGLKNIMGFEVSRRLGMPYTPAQEPVELVINGDYKGLYNLTENIRIDKDRVAITKVSGGCTDPDSITGGWLVEIDNYTGPCQISLVEGNGEPIMITYHDPEVLSTQQRNYLQQQMEAINTALYLPDLNSTAWEQLVDMDQLVRFYLTQEVLEDTESFHGSCYIYKEIGTAEKWHFGPVWDFGNSFWRSAERFIYDGPSFSQIWIGQAAAHPRFQAALRRVWSEFYRNEYPSLSDFAYAYWARISTAFRHDAARWPNLQEHSYRGNLAQQFMQKIDWRIGWLYSQWGLVSALDELETLPLAEVVDECIYDLHGRPLMQPASSLPAGVYIVRTTYADGTIRSHKLFINR